MSVTEAQSHRQPNAVGVSRTPLGDHALLARVLSSIVSAEPLDTRAPSLTVCRMADGRFGICETTDKECLVVGEPVSIHDAADLAMCVVRGDGDIASHPYTAHSIATVLLALIAGAAIRSREPSRPIENHIVVPFPAARGLA